jgi:hypothetical protein
MNVRKKTHRMSLFLLLLALAVFPGDAWAVQSHGAPEGSYVHQLAHIFYTASMGYLFWGIRRSSFKSRGWLFLQAYCFFIILWNVVAFTGHSLAPYVEPSFYTSGNGYLSTHLVGPFSSLKLWVYFTKLDHLFSIPALLCLYLGMKGLYHSSLEEEEV